MRQRKYKLFRLAGFGLLPLMSVLCTATADAGDEDMSPSAYHIFDPVTGYMITVDPQAEEQDPTTSDEASPELEPTEVEDGHTTPVPWHYWIVAIVVSGGILVWLSKRRESHD